MILAGLGAAPALAADVAAVPGGPVAVNAINIPLEITLSEAKPAP